MVVVPPPSALQLNIKCLKHTGRQKTHRQGICSNVIAFFKLKNFENVENVDKNRLVTAATDLSYIAWLVKDDIIDH